MNYVKIYNNLMERGQTRQITNPLTEYTEEHHIIPQCMGGTNDKTNLVLLTAEEHFVAHQLLVKMYPTTTTLVWALAMMMGNNSKIKRNNKWYGWIRRKFVIQVSKPKSEETRQKMSRYWSEYRKQHPVTDEMKEKMRARNLGKTLSEETRRKMSEAHKGRPKSEEYKRKMSEQRKGKKKPPRSDEYRKLLSDNMKLVWAARKKQKEILDEGNRT